MCPCDQEGAGDDNLELDREFFGDKVWEWQIKTNIIQKKAWLGYMLKCMYTHTNYCFFFYTIDF